MFAPRDRHYASKNFGSAQLPYPCTLHNQRCGVHQHGTPRARMRSWLTATDMHPPAPPSMPLLFPTCPALSPPPRRRSPAAGSAAAGAPQERDSDRQRESGKERERQGEILTTKCDLTLLVRSHLGSDVACQIAADQLMRSFRRFRCLAAFSFFPYCPDRPWQMKFRRELTVGIPTETY